jgi:hypothetical protein
MKKLLTATLTICLCTSALSAVSIRYYNNDSKTHTFKAKIDGTNKEVTFDSSRTSDVTIQGSDNEAIIYTNCGEVKVKTNASIEIKDGCIK